MEDLSRDNDAALDPTPLKEESGPVEYVVQPGDTLESIALARYGDATKAQSIYERNRATGALVTENLIIGQVLTLE